MLTAQNAGTREIATMRLAWMAKLRDTVAQFHSILMIREDVDQAKSAEELSLLGTQLDLLLNREDKFQRDLWEITDKTYNSQSQEERQSMDEKLIAAGRAVLKAEWEKVKAEMRGSRSKRESNYSFGAMDGAASNRFAIRAHVRDPPRPFPQV